MEITLDIDQAEDMTETDIAMSTLKERYFWANDLQCPLITLPVLSIDGFSVGETIRDGREKGDKKLYEITAFCTVSWGENEGDTVAYLGNTTGYMTRDRWKKSS